MGSRTDFGFQVAYALTPEAASSARASPCGREGAAGPAVDGEAQRGGPGDDRDAGAQGELAGAGADVAGDLLLQPGQPFGVLDEGLGADRVEAVDIDVEPDRGVVRIQFQGAER